MVLQCKSTLMQRKQMNNHTNRSRFEKRKTTITDKNGDKRSHFTFWNMDNTKRPTPKKRSNYTKHGTLRSIYKLGE